LCESVKVLKTDNNMVPLTEIRDHR